MTDGWIKLHRKLLDSPIASKKEWGWLWIVMLLLASHEGKEFIHGRTKIKISPGQFVTGRLQLAEKSGLSPSSVERALNFMKSEQQIEQQKTTKYRLITILNWDEYQKVNTKADSNGTATGQQRDTIKNVKKDKKEKNIIPAETSSARKEPVFNPQGAEIIKAFESINPACKRMYGNTTQRKACDDLINEYSFERVLKVVQGALPKTNRLEFMPTITTPLQLYDKWPALESAIVKYKAKANINSVAFN